MARRVRCALLLQLLVGCVYAHVAVAAQSQETLNERYQSQIRRIDDDVTSLRAQNIDARLRVLENSMTEVMWLGRCVAAAVVGQLAIAVFARGARGK